MQQTGGLFLDNAGSLFYQLGAHLASAPNLQAVDEQYQIYPDAAIWLAKLCAIADLSNAPVDAAKIKVAADFLAAGLSTQQNAATVIFVARRILAKLELEAPSAAKGAFISTGEDFSAYAAVARIIGEATKRVMVVDPYMDATVLTEFLAGAPEGVEIRLLAADGASRPDLPPACRRWEAQYGQSRPLYARLTPKRSLHDRLLIIDDKEAWILTQSLKDFAKRSHATIQKADTDMAALKVSAYEEIWEAATPLLQSEGSS